MITSRTFWIYVFFAAFFAVVLLGVGMYEARRADRKLAAKLAEAGVLRHHKNETRPSL